MNKKLKSILAVVLPFVGFALLILALFLHSLPGTWQCGMSAGPIYGQSIQISLDTMHFDEYLDIPGGQFALSNTIPAAGGIDTIPPILVKFDKQHRVVWALRLDAKESGIPLYEMGGMSFYEDDDKRIYFFNKSYSEPGSLFLDNEYNLRYVCLSPM